MVWFIAVVLCAFSFHLAASTPNPGISLRVTQKAFDYVSENTIKPLLLQEIKTAKIPDVTTKTSGIKIIISGIRTTFEKVSSIVITPDSSKNALSVKMVLTVFGQSRWYFRTDAWPHISGKGNLNFWMSNINIGLDLNMSPGKDGVWNFTMSELNMNMHFSMKFHGGSILGWILNILKGTIEGIAKKSVISAARKAVTNGIKKLTPLLHKYLPLLHLEKVSPKAKDFALDLRLLSSGVWKDHCYAEMPLSGRFFYKNQSYMPYPASPFPELKDCKGRMVRLLLSGGTVSSLSAAVVASGLARASFPTVRLANDAIVHEFIPGLSKFGGSRLDLDLQLSNCSVHLLKGAIHMDFTLLAGIDVTLTNGTTLHDVLRLSLPFSLQVTEWVKSSVKTKGAPVMNLICINFTQATLGKISVIKSQVGQVYSKPLQKFAQTQMNIYRKNANELVTTGVYFVPDLINVKLIEISNISFGVFKDYFEVGIDLRANGNSSNSTNSSSLSSSDLDEVTDEMLTRLFHPIVEGSIQGARFVVNQILMAKQDSRKAVSEHTEMHARRHLHPLLTVQKKQRLAARKHHHRHGRIHHVLSLKKHRSQAARVN